MVRVPQLSFGHSGLFIPMEEHSKDRVTILVGEIFLNYHEALGLPLHNRDKEEYAWNSGDSLRGLLVFPFLISMVNEKLS